MILLLMRFLKLMMLLLVVLKVMADFVSYTNLLFSSYNNTVDLYSIQVVLTQAGQVYMRTRYGGLIGGTPIVSDWDEAVVELSGIDGDKYWDQTVPCINANKYGWEGSRKIVDEKWHNTLTVYGDTKVTAISNKWSIDFGGPKDSISVPDSAVIELYSSSYTIEFVFSIDSTSVMLVFDKGTNINVNYGCINCSITSGSKLQFYVNPQPNSSLNRLYLNSTTTLSADLS